MQTRSNLEVLALSEAATSAYGQTCEQLAWTAAALSEDIDHVSAGFVRYVLPGSKADGHMARQPRRAAAVPRLARSHS